MCDKVNKEVWGQAYNIVTKKFGTALPTLSRTHQAAEILEVLFSKGEAYRMREMTCKDCRPFAVYKVQEAVKRSSNKKSPNLDGVPMRFVKILTEVAPLSVTDTLNLVLKEERVPTDWKSSRVVLLKKTWKEWRST